MVDLFVDQIVSASNIIKILMNIHTTYDTNILILSNGYYDFRLLRCIRLHLLAIVLTRLYCIYKDGANRVVSFTQSRAQEGLDAATIIAIT